MLILLYRALAVVFAILAGWALGMASPDWRADVEATRDDGFMPRFWAIGNGMARLRFLAGNPMAGLGSFVIWVLPAIIFAALGWGGGNGLGDPGPLAGLGRSGMEREYGSFMLLFEPSTWIMLGSFCFGYVMAKVQEEKDGGAQY